jgi:hypothetical protein
MKRIIILAILMWCSLANAEGQFALVDSVHTESSVKTFLSLDAPTSAENDDSITLTGTLWNQEVSSKGFQDTEISINNDVLKSFKTVGNRAYVGDLEFSGVQRKLIAGNQVILRKVFVSKNEDSVISVSDDPGPLAVAAFIAGAAVAICTTKTIYDMLQCPEGSKLKIGLKDGFTCESECR